MTREQLQQVAARLREAEATGIACDPIRDLISVGGIDAAYQVQQINRQFWGDQGRRSVGCKIGLTSQSVQQQLGVNQPDFGGLYADMAIADGDDIVINKVLQPKVEAEVALVLEHDLTMEQPTMTDLIRATAFVLPAIEIVGSRIANWNINILDTIADNASSGMYVLGNHPKKLDQLDLRLCGMVMTRKGEPVSVGAGQACLGHPLNAALWVSRTFASRGQGLKAGDTILTGALGPMVPAVAGDRFEARINGLGSVRIGFGKEA
ncbi:2-keto-4-pentenoate hydratase [Shewanella sp. NIFS-20-20]|uniref:2-keto-4-pentenoate hydratase n=1 Tax=Shewanella sp. NIFS-20-20 TaxID=2853806 RepID=UPI001C48D2BB|nr:2-keto-4-pentenoate hydratase [Shewanella sp. NIFS-20-20]MBV7315109.1 2-keto-4-pentenoate hydratase [Shewanella sp. NIFS-20-20]